MNAYMFCCINAIAVLLVIRTVRDFSSSASSVYTIESTVPIWKRFGIRRTQRGWVYLYITYTYVCVCVCVLLCSRLTGKALLHPVGSEGVYFLLTFEFGRARYSLRTARIVIYTLYIYRATNGRRRRNRKTLMCVMTMTVSDDVITFPRTVSSQSAFSAEFVSLFTYFDLLILLGTHLTLPALLIRDVLILFVCMCNFTKKWIVYT